MAVAAMLVVEVQAFFLAEAGQKGQIAFAVLHAVVARRIARRPQGEAIVAVEDAVLLEQLCQDLGHAAPLEDAGIDAVGQAGQARYQVGAIAGQAPARIALGHGGELAVDALVTRTQGEKGGPLQQRFQRPVRALADQLELEAIGLADGLVAVEGE